MSKVIVWVIIGILTILLILMLYDYKMTGGGGDAATRGIGKGINNILISLIVSLVVFNLLPYDWSKYIALFIGFIGVVFIVAFFLFFTGNFHQNTSRNNPVYEEPRFDDPIVTEMYTTFTNRDVGTWKKLLQTHPEHIHNKLLQNQILMVNDLDAPRIACIKYMIDSGAKIVTEFSDFIFPFAGNSEVEMVDLFLQNGADPNAIEDRLNHWPLIYEAISGGYGSKVEVITSLIKHGADANAKIKNNEYQDTLTPLLFAVHREYWHSCIALLENGADPNYKNKDGISIKEMVLQKAKTEKDEGHYPFFWEFVELLKK